MAEGQLEANPRLSPPGGLTEKQCHVLDLLIVHMTSKEIARKLGISPHTVDQRLKFAREKLGARNRSELAAFYRGLVSNDEQAAYGFSDLEPNVAEDVSDDQHLEASPTSGRDSAVEDSGIRPVLVDQPNGTLLRIASMMMIALVLLLIILGSFALYDYVTRMLGR